MKQFSGADLLWLVGPVDLGTIQTTVKTGDVKEYP
jgi:hypothetical protein